MLSAGYITKPESGFSMVELMITVVIFSVIVALALPSYRAFVQNTYIRSTAESIINGLQLARAEAVKRNTQVRFMLGANSAWTVGCLVVVGDNNGDGVDDCPAIIQSHSTGEGSSTSVTVTPNPGTANSVIFSNLGMVNVNAATFTEINVDVNASALSSDESRNLRIVVGAGGNARMCDPNVTESTDSRKC